MSSDFYRFRIGNVVQTARHGPWLDVVWRGRQQLTGRDGKLYPVPVYRLRGEY